MSRSIIEVSVPSTELVQLSDMDTMLHGYATSEESFLTLVIQAARNYVEGMTGYSLMPRNFIQYCDRFPMQSVLAPMFPYLRVVPNPGVYGQRSPYEITLLRNPVQAIDHIVYVDVNGNPQTLEPETDFVADTTSVPGRVTPLPVNVGSLPLVALWPACLPGPKSVAIYFSAGYYQTTQNEMTPEDQPRQLGYPPILKLIVMQLAAHWFTYRDLGAVPPAIDDLLIANRVVDYNPSVE
jgi:hypothetical protein